MLLATADSREGYGSVAAQVVLAHAPVGTAEFGDGRGAVMALEVKNRLYGESRMQELHNQLANLQVTAADKDDPARVIQELRRIGVELEALGDIAVPARKTHAFFRALSDEKYDSLKTGLPYDKQSDDGSSKFEDTAVRATSYHSMQIRDKIAAKDERTGGKNDVGRHESALNTTAHEEPRNSRRINGRGQGRGYRGNGNTSSSTKSNNINDDHTSTSNGNSSDNSNADRREDVSEKSHKKQASGRGGRQRGQNNAKNRHGRCNYCRNPTEHGWHDCPLRLSHQQSDDTQNANAALVGAEGTICHAWCTQVETTENAHLESFQVAGNGAGCSPSCGKMYHGANTHVQEDI